MLRELARTLDPDATVERFPGLARAELSRLLKQAAELLPVAPSPVRRKPETAAAELFPSPAGESAGVWVDGGSRGNPGPAGAGAVLLVKGSPRRGRGEYLGEATNNVAEYRALLLGLSLAREAGVRTLTVHADSELMVRQMTGRYRVKNPDLLRLHTEARKEAARFASVTYRHVPREENVLADRLVNQALDVRGSVTL